MLGNLLDIMSQPSLAFTVLSTALYFTFVVNPIVFYKRRRRYLLLASTGGKRVKKSSTVNIGAIFGMDVGGTLTKIVYFQADNNTDTDGPAVLQRRNSSENLANLESPDHQAALEQLYTHLDPQTGALLASRDVIRDTPLTVYSNFLRGSLHFLHFETRNMINAINFLSSTAVTEHIKTIGCTGGGAHKYDSTISEELDIHVHKYDELGCLVRGMLFALTNFPDELYTFRTIDDEDINSTSSSSDKEPISLTDANETEQSDKKIPTKAKLWQRDSKECTIKVGLPFPEQSAFPHLIVNIGSGVSILKVSGPGKFERVSGTSLGGGTYWGLCRLLTKCKTYEEVLDLAENGDAGKVDMLVRDIYGGDYGGMLTGSLVASSFGKIVMKDDPMEGVREEDLALALLMMMSNNIGQIAHLCAKLHDCNKIFFVGSFLRHNSISCRRLAFAINFWSEGTMDALFLTHEGYLGALGTFLHSAFGDDVDKILYENEKHHPVETNRPSFASSDDPVIFNDSSAAQTTGKSPQARASSPFTSSSSEKLNTLRRLSKNFADWSKSFSDSTADPESPQVSAKKSAPSASRRGRSSSDDWLYRSTK